MKFVILALAAAGVASAQVVSENGEFKCLGEAAGKNFCAGASLETNIIIRCTGEKGQPGNCNNNLAGVPPVGVKSFAPCYQTSDSSGDAACSYNGVVYPDSGEPYPIPGYPVSSISTGPSTYGPPPPSYDSTSSSVTLYPTDSSTATTETVYPTAPTDTTQTVYPTAPTTVVYPTAPINNTTVYPTNTLEYPSTLSTVTGTVTITTCQTACTHTSQTYVPTGTPGPVPPSNQTSSTTSLPIPTQIPSGAGALIAKDGLVLGAIAIIGFLFL